MPQRCGCPLEASCTARTIVRKLRKMYESHAATGTRGAGGKAAHGTIYCGTSLIHLLPRRAPCDAISKRSAIHAATRHCLRAASACSTMTWSDFQAKPHATASRPSPAQHTSPEAHRPDLGLPVHRCASRTRRAIIIAFVQVRQAGLALLVARLERGALLPGRRHRHAHHVVKP